MSQPIRAGITILLFAIATAVANCSNGVIRLTSFPSMTVADGRSTLTISAEVRDRSGNIVPDGTQVVFATNMGSFVEPVTRTVSGTARAIFSAGSVPGIAKIQASALTYNAVSILDIELVSDRNMLTSAKEFIEISAENYLMYSLDHRIMGAAAPERGVAIRFRDISIDADDVQLTIPSKEVRARNAKVKFGTYEREFTELYFKMDSKEGFGITTFEVPNSRIVATAKLFKFETSTVKRLGMAQISGQNITPYTKQLPSGIFEFTDLLESTSTISAKKAFAYPRGQIQFHRASIFIGTQRVMSMPMYQLDMNSSSPLATEQFLNVYNSQVALNYPYYLTLEPGETSAIRFRTGERYGRNSTSLGGVFLDYEWNWNKGQDMDGGLTVTGLNRKDWSIGARQYLRLDSKTVASAQLEFPSHRSVFGSASVQRHGDGYHMSVNASSSRSLKGTEYQTQQYSAVIEKSPTKVGTLPLRLFYGVTANSSSSDTASTHFQQNSVGARVRMQVLPILLDKRSTLMGSMSLSHLQGDGVKNGLTTIADLSLSHQFGDGAALFMSYNYTDDGFASAVTGRNSLNVNGIYDRGKLSFSFNASKSLDMDRQSYFFDSSFLVSDQWRVSYQYTFDQFLGDRYIDDLAMLSYRVGVREIGVTYSIQRKRIGIQLFGSQF